MGALFLGLYKAAMQLCMGHYLLYLATGQQSRPLLLGLAADAAGALVPWSLLEVFYFFGMLAALREKKNV